MTVRTRLTLAVAGVMGAGLILFATLSIATIDRALRTTLESELLTKGQAIAGTIDVHDGVPDPDSGDRREISTLRADTHAAVLDARGNLVFGETPPPAPDIRIASVPVERHGDVAGSVVTWRSDAWIAEVVRYAIVTSLAVALVLIGVGIAVSRWAANAALLPLVRIAATAERIEANDLSQRLHAENDAGDELGRLTASFDRMLDRLQSAFAHERRFSADASHELRAPLAVLRAETELALRRDRDNEEYRRALESIAREAERLEHLVDDLLAAARVEADAADLREVDVNAIVRDVAARIETPAALKHVGVATEGSAPAAIGEPGAIERALLGVAHNAITFAPERGTVRLTMTSDADAVSVEVADSGPGFSREALEHATERFWRADGARPRGGTGLGLAIARAIVERSGGTLSIANAPGGGGLVTMRLRRSR